MDPTPKRRATFLPAVLALCAATLLGGCVVAPYYDAYGNPVAVAPQRIRPIPTTTTTAPHTILPPSTAVSGSATPAAAAGAATMAGTAVAAAAGADAAGVTEDPAGRPEKANSARSSIRMIA